MKKTLLLLLCTYISITVHAQTTSIPDTNFEQALIDLGYDSGTIDGKVPTVNIKNITFLNINNKSISDMTGIQDFELLETLWARGNNFNSLDISKNLELQSLALDNSHSLQNLDVSKNVKLSFLGIACRNLNNLDVSQNIKLKTLIIASSNISSIDISKNTDLTRFVFINSTPKLSNLDLSNNLKLGDLDIRGNALTSIDLSKNINLTKLISGDNLLTTLDLSKNTKLQIINVVNNKLTSLNIKNGNNDQISANDIDLRQNPNLTCVQVDNLESALRWSGKRDIATRFSENCNAKTWNGFVSNDWNNKDNWHGNTVPTTTDDVIIPIPSQVNNHMYPTISAPTTVKSIVLESGATLIANASVSGNVVFKKKIKTNNWYLISSPLRNSKVEDFIASHNLASGTNGNIGMAYYDYSQNLAKDRWRYLKAGAKGLSHAFGFAIKLVNQGEISFSGNISSGQHNTEIVKNSSPFNLIGNPYPSLINSASFLTRNTDLLDSQTIWVWNQATSSYDTKVTADNFKIAAGQAFFVKAKMNGQAIFKTTDQTHGTDTFQKIKIKKSELKLNVRNGKKLKYAKVYFVDNATNGFDNGYDGELFSEGDSKFEVYSELLVDNNNKYQIQSLPFKRDHIIIPIGIKAKSKDEIQFSLVKENFSKNVNVFLEDKEEKLITKLDNTVKPYTIILPEDIKGTGRFYLHVSSKEITNEDIITTSNLAINQINKNTFQVKGVKDIATVFLYTIQGKLAMIKKIKTNNNKFQLPSLASGIYIIKVSNRQKILTKKIILE